MNVYIYIFIYFILFFFLHELCSIRCFLEFMWAKSFCYKWERMKPSCQQNLCRLHKWTTGNSKERMKERKKREAKLKVCINHYQCSVHKYSEFLAYDLDHTYSVTFYLEVCSCVKWTPIWNIIIFRFLEICY